MLFCAETQYDEIGRKAIAKLFLDTSGGGSKTRGYAATFLCCASRYVGNNKPTYPLDLRLGRSALCGDKGREIQSSCYVRPFNS